MNPVVAVIAPGMMGAAVAGRLVENGLKVLTCSTGRAPRPSRAPRSMGLTSATDEEIAAADFILSILPPGDAASLAQRFAPALTASNSKPVYVDCNAVSPRPRSGSPPRSRPPARPSSTPASSARRPSRATPGRASTLRGPTRRASPRSGNTGSTSGCSTAHERYASAVKMSYAGITKGTQALAAVMVLAAARGGSADALFKELHSASRTCWPGSSAACR